MFKPLYLLIAFISLANCETILSRRPTIDFVDADVTDLTMKYIDLRLKLKLNNPYPIKLPPGALGGDLSLDGKTITGITTTTPEVAAAGAGTFPLQIRIPFASIMNLGQDLEKKEEFHFRVKGNADVQVTALAGAPAARLNLPFDYEQNVPAFVPDITFGNLQLEAPSMASPSAGISFDLGVRNKAAGKFNLGKMDFQLLSNGMSLLNGSTSEVVNSGTETKARIVSKVSLLAVPFALLQGSKNFTVKGGTTLSFPGFFGGKTFPLQFEKPLQESAR